MNKKGMVIPLIVPLVLLIALGIFFLYQDRQISSGFFDSAGNEGLNVLDPLAIYSCDAGVFADCRGQTDTYKYNKIRVTSKSEVRTKQDTKQWKYDQRLSGYYSTVQV